MSLKRVKIKARVYAMSLSTTAIEHEGSRGLPPCCSHWPLQSQPWPLSVSKRLTPASLYLPTLARPFKAQTAGRWRCPGILSHSKLRCHCGQVHLSCVRLFSLPVSLQLAPKMYSASVEIGPLDTHPFLLTHA